MDLTPALLTLAGGAFMVPVIVLTPTKPITRDVAGMMLIIGLRSIAFSVMVAAPGCSPAGQRDRDAGKLDSR